MGISNIVPPKPVPSRPPIKSLVFTSFILIITAFGGSFYWAINAPLQSATIATGKVVVESFKKEMQHLDGGIVAAINVKDGMEVTRGQELITLDRTRIQANIDLLTGEKNALSATEARLIAERDNLDNIEFPEELLNAANPKLAKIIRGQQDIFKTNRYTFNKLKNIHEEQIKILEKNIASGEQQLQADRNSVFYLKKELAAVQKLVDNKRIEENMLWDIQGKLARAESEMFSNERSVTQAKNSIVEIQKRIIADENERSLKIVNELREIQRELAQTEEQIVGVLDQLKRTSIYAPLAGIVVNLKVHTIGGVIKAGETFMEIVPLNDRLIVEAEIKPNDIDSVHPGLQTHVRLSAYNTRYLPDLLGTLIYVSADAVLNPTTKEYHYVGRVEIPDDELDKVSSVELYPGMITEVMIVTDKRTFWDYFTTPIINSLNRAFREQ